MFHNKVEMSDIPSRRLERLKVLQTLIAHLESHEGCAPPAQDACPLAGDLRDTDQIVRVLRELRDEVAFGTDGGLPARAPE